MNEKIISKKFKNISVEDDTRILLREEVKFGDYDAIHEVWVWEGIQAESLIFIKKDINGLNKNEVLKFVDKDEATYQKKDEYTFVNFNFTIPY